MKMKDILNKYSDCDVFSLTGSSIDYKITQDEFEKAVKTITEQYKNKLREKYNAIDHTKYPNFDDLYSEIYGECSEFCNDKNKEKYLNEHFDESLFKQIGFSNSKIDNMKRNFFSCMFIIDGVGKTTKYGKEDYNFFYNFYQNVSMIKDCENNKDRFAKDGIDPKEQIPKKLKNSLIKYEISFFNSVNISSQLMINYYFTFDDESKSYLSKFKDDFDLKELQDLTLYKDDKIQFYSCTHEKYNSIDR